MLMGITNWKPAARNQNSCTTPWRLNLKVMKKTINHSYKDIFILPVGRYYILHSPLRGISALANKMAIAYLYDILVNNDKNEEKRNAIDFLLISLEETPLSRPYEPGDIPDPLFLGLIPTRSCNGGCIYCGFDNQGEFTKDMDYQTVITAIEWMANRMLLLEKNKLEIHFFGGEPLFTPDIVNVAVHYARMVCDKKGLFPHFEISTNGLVSEQTSRFVAEHFHSVVLSLDGFEEIQNLQRPLKNGSGSFNQAVMFAEKMGTSNTDLFIRACISNVNVEKMPEITEWFCRRFKPNIINFENMKTNPKAEKAGLHEPDPFVFARFFNIALDIAADHGVKVINSSIASEMPQYSSCPVGKDTLIVSPDNTIHSCYLFPSRWKEKGMDLSVGSIEDNRFEVSDKKLLKLRQMVKDKPRCSSCFCQWTCAGGCHVDVSFPGSDETYDNYCRQTRMLGVINILRNLGQFDVLGEFLADNSILSEFVNRKSDKLEDWNEKHNE